MIDNRLHRYLALAISRQASDLHLQPNARPYLRIGSNLFVIGSTALNEIDCQAIIDSTMSEDQKVALRDKLELDYSFSVPNMGRFRANTYKAQGHYESVIRIVSLEPKSADELHLPNVIKELALKPTGLIFVSGTTGSGKSTTLAAMVNEINRKAAKRIITVENPVEILHTNKKALISQREIGADTNNFATAIRSALRQDPDVILIGEIRDKETAEAALQAAQTGHLVMSTIHAGSIEELLGRFTSLFPPEDRQGINEVMAVVLRGAVVQKLVDGLNGERLPALEILVNTARAAEAIIGRSQQESITTVIEQGEYNEMKTLDQSLVQLVQEKLISPETALREARRRQSVLNTLRSLNLMSTNTKKES